MSRFPKWVVVVAVAVSLVFAGLVWSYKNTADLTVANPLANAVLVRLDSGQPFSVAGESKSSGHLVSAGLHLLEVTDEKSGEPIETFVALFPGERSLAVYNVLGLAPVYLEKIVYATHSPPPGTPQVFCGSKFFSFEKINDAWTEPPSEVKLDKYGNSVTRTHLDLAAGGLRTCRAYSLSQKNSTIDTIALALHGPAEQRLGTLTTGNELGLAAADVREHLSGNIEADLLYHRMLQSLFMRSQRQNELQPLYAGRLGDDETDRDVYLANRLLPNEERLRGVTAGLAKFPDSTWLRWSAASSLMQAGRDAEALAAFHQLRDVNDASLADRVPRIEATLLARSGKVKAARAVLEAYATKGDANSRDLSFALMLQAARMATGSSEPVDDLVAENAQRELRVLELGVDKVGLFKDDKGKDEMVFIGKGRRLTIEGLTDPAHALKTVSTESDATLKWADERVLLLLLTEAWRVGDAKAASLIKIHPMTADLDEVRAFLVNGSWAGLGDHLDDDVAALLWFARSRWAPDTASTQLAIGRLKQLEPLGGLARLALERWPAPTPTVRPALAWEWTKK